MSENDEQLLARWKGGPEHAALLQHVKAPVVECVVDFLTGSHTTEQLRELHALAKARYQVLQTISLDGLPPEVFSSDTVEDLEARKKARIQEIEKFWRERAAQGSRTL